MNKNIEFENIKLNPEVKKAIVHISDLMQTGKKPIIVAIDGRSGTGKSTIAKYIANRLNGQEIVSDNFWVGGENEYWDKLEPKERANKAIDWKRIRTEVLEPLLVGKEAKWHPFNWATGTGLAPHYITCKPCNLVILDGAYSTRPELLDIIDFTILVTVSNDSDRRTRLVNRETSEYMSDWHKRWDPAEDYYYTNVRLNSSFDLIINNN